MTNLTTKELSSITDQLNLEGNLVAKRNYHDMMEKFINIIVKNPKQKIF